MANIWNRIKGYFNSSPAGGMVFVDRSANSLTRGSREILSLYHQSPWLRAVVTKIAQHYASVPWSLYRVTTTSTKQSQRLRNQLTHKSLEERSSIVKKAVQTEQLEEIYEHPLLTMWEGGNKAFGGHKVRELTCKYYDTVGEVPWIIERNSMGLPAELWPVPPTWIVKLPENKSQPVELRWGTITKNISQNDIIWFRDENLINPYGRGIGIAHSLSDELDSDEYAAQMIKQAFENRGLLDVVISIEGAREDQLQRARAEFQNRHGGWLKAGVPFFHSGKADVKVVSQSFTEMQLLQLREWERDTIISIYGVPPELLGVLGKSNRATITESREIMASEVLVPRLEYTKNVVNQKLVPQFGDDLYMDYENPSPGNSEFVLRAMQANPATVTVREWRELQGLTDRGDRDEYTLIPMGLTPFRGSYGTQDDAEQEPQAMVPVPVLGEPGATGEPQKALAVPVMKVLSPTQRADAVLGYLTPEPFERLLTPVIKDCVDSFVADELQSLGVGTKAVDASNIFDSVIVFLQEFSSKKIGGINKTTRDLIRATLIEGYEQGEGARELGARVQDVFEVNAHRGMVIARTEVARAANYAQYLAQKESGIVTGREWVSTRDDRTRGASPQDKSNHLAMDGVTAKAGEKFALVAGVNTGATAWHPLGFNIPEEDIQCRCTIAPIVDEFKTMRTTEMRDVIWKAFDRKLVPFEDKAEEGTSKAFAEQQRAIVNALTLF